MYAGQQSTRSHKSTVPGQLGPTSSFSGVRVKVRVKVSVTVKARVGDKIMA